MKFFTVGSGVGLKDLLQKAIADAGFKRYCRDSNVTKVYFTIGSADETVTAQEVESRIRDAFNFGGYLDVEEDQDFEDWEINDD